MTAKAYSYDDNQINARLIKCASCGREYFQVVPRANCLNCEPFIKNEQPGKLNARV